MTIEQVIKVILEVQGNRFHGTLERNEGYTNLQPWGGLDCKITLTKCIADVSKHFKLMYLKSKKYFLAEAAANKMGHTT